MAREPIVKSAILCHARHRAELLKVVEASGAVQLINLAEVELPVQAFTPAKGNERSLIERLARIDRVLDFLTPMMPPRPWGRQVRESPPAFSHEELGALLEDEELDALVIRVGEVMESLTAREHRLKALAAEEQVLKPWQRLPVPVESLGSRTTYHLAAVLADGEVRRRVAAVLEDEPLAAGHVVSEGDGWQRLVLAAHRTVAEDILQALREAGVTFEEFSGRRGLVRDLLAANRAEQEEERRALAAERELTREFAAEVPRIRALRDALGLEETRAGAVQFGRASSRAFLLYAWIRQGELPALQARLERLGEVDAEILDPDPDEEVPSALSQKPAVEPYEMLTEMFGSPAGHDPDPTPLLAPFFALFFGICVGDAGYGLFLAAGAGVGWWLVRRRHGNPRLFALLFQGGLASVVVGALLGTWFAIEQERLPGVMQAIAAPLNALAPEGEAFGLSRQFLYVTLALGLVQLAFGVVVRLTKRWRAGERLAGVVEQGAWLLAMAGMFPWLFNHYLLDGILYDTQGPMDRIYLTIFAVGAVLIFVMGGRQGRGVGRVGLGMYAAYGIINLLGDVLSYSRLFALALSSAIIAQVINQMAGMVAGMGIPVLGLVLAALVLLGGHLFNLFMAVLSGYIHTARLQFVEFFSKFYDGTGVPFSPLRYEPRFVIVQEER